MLNTKSLDRSISKKIGAMILNLCALGLISTILLACQPNPGPVQKSGSGTDMKGKLSQAPETRMIPTVQQSARAENYDIYKLIETHISADPGKKTISVRALVQSSAGTETVELEGQMREDGSATLVDLDPLPESKYRLTAEGYCIDKDVCKKILLNVYYRVAGKTIRKQFVTPEVLEDRQSTKKVSAGSNPTPSTPHPHPLSASQGSVTTETDGDDEKDHTDREDTEELFDHGRTDPNDPNDELVGKEQMVEFVGPPRNESLIGKLWERPEVPSLPPTPTPTSTPRSNELPAPQAAPTQSLTVTATPTPQPPSAAKSTPKVASNESGSAKANTKDSSDSAKATTRPAATPNSKSLVQEKLQQKSMIEKAPDTKESKPQTPKEKVNNPSRSQSKSLPGVNDLEDKAIKDRLSLLEKKIAPLLDLKSGGYASGSHTHGRLLNGTRLKDGNEIDSFKTVYPKRDTHWGTGLMISLIENGTAFFKREFFQNGQVMLGDISKKNGGDIGSHASHQSGLDADIPYIGNSKFETVITAKGGVGPNFNYEKNWQFFRLIASQKIIQDGQKLTVLNRIFVNPVVKKNLCKWALHNNILDDPFDADIMRRIRPTGGHHKHFHVRLRCSPHYPTCRNQAEPPSGTGC
jgi:murein endopeptidase